MKALLSDIHGNLEALHAVLEDVSRHPVEAVYCLGDVVGYGPDPRGCLDLAMSWRVAKSCPRTFHDACPHKMAAAWSVVVSVMPGRKTFTEMVSRTMWRP